MVRGRVVAAFFLLLQVMQISQKPAEQKGFASTKSLQRQREEEEEE
jgi:hypothetical protein